MIVKTLTRAVRRHFVPGQIFAFMPARGLSPPAVKSAGLYIHIPFCMHLCPYCPYNRIPYREDLVQPFTAAILNEIKAYQSLMGRIQISSIYIGGGTPTHLLAELGIILENIRCHFDVNGPVCIETNPADISQLTVLRLQEYGISMVSLGGQSFDDRYLRFLGRKYSGSTVQAAIEQLCAGQFDSVNLDMMFALGDQSVADVEADMGKALASGVDQITAYPLFCFPYSTVGAYRRLKNIDMPPLRKRRQMYYAIYDHCISCDFQPVSVWGFKRGDAPRYSSVTRDHYIGLGPGAGSLVPGMFYLNTFSVPAYIGACDSQQLPIAMKMDFNPAMERYYWLYWRFYDTHIPESASEEIFKQDGKFHRLMRLLQIAGWCCREDGGYHLTAAGAFWLHLMQNYFALNYVNSIWTRGRQEEWPLAIPF